MFAINHLTVWSGFVSRVVRGGHQQASDDTSLQVHIASRIITTGSPCVDQAGFELDLPASAS